MPRGGARTNSGPAPDPTALRRERDAGEWTVLPAEGRPGDAPEWPLVGRCARELDLWDRLWAKPQALMWERLGQELEVALYVRNLALAEQPGAPVNLGTLVRQMADSLGLTTPGLRNNRWRITRDEVTERRQDTPAPSARPSSRARLKVVGGDA
ncbi:hypothetical protein [Micromonospora orduensis]|uniref:hypothetical protein n=1 Tax=Micromonospora orduensis TaxID=1420891 RepID=UPI0033F67746